MEPAIRKIASHKPKRKGSTNPLVNMANAMFGKKTEDLIDNDQELNDLEKTFLKAAYKVEDLKKYLIGDEWLRAYSLYKQATEGDCSNKKPSKMFKTRYLKHEYWLQRRGMPSDAAAKRYIELAKEYEELVNKRGKQKPTRQRKRKPAKQELEPIINRRGSAPMPASVENAPESLEDNLFVLKPKKKFDRGRASVEFNKFLSRRLNSAGAAFSEDNFLVNFSSADQSIAAPNSFVMGGTAKNSTILLANQSIRASVRTRYIPSEVEFQRFTLVRNSTMHTATSLVNFTRPDYKYRGPTLEELVEEGRATNDPFLSESVHLDNSKIDEVYHDILPVIHLLKVEYLREMSSNPVEIDPEDKTTQTLLNIPLDKFIFRLVRYLDRWFDDNANINSAGSRSLIITKIYLDNKIRESIDDFKVSQLNIHKLLAVCMLLSAKYCEDCLIANSYWAQVAGMTVQQLNEFEELILDATNFDLYVSNEELSVTGKKYHLYMEAENEIANNIVPAPKANLTEQEANI